jgi:hypothetical protein
MSTTFFSSARLTCATLCLFLLMSVAAHAADVVLKLEAQLVVGSNVPHQTNGVPVSVKIAKKLATLPLKWQYYYVVNSQQFSVAKDESKEIKLSSEIQISVKNLGGENIKMTLVNNGRNVGNVKQTLPKGHVSAIGANAANSIVVLRQAD